MNNFFLFKTNIIKVRALNQNDIEEFPDLFYHDVDVANFLNTPKIPKTKEVQKDFYFKSLENENSFGFIAFNYHDECLGICGLSKLSWINRSAHIGAYLREKHQQKGYGKELCSAVIHYALNELNFNRIESIILEKNIACIKLFEALGAKYEGTLRKAFFMHGIYENFVMMSVLKDEFKPFSKEKNHEF